MKKGICKRIGLMCIIGIIIVGMCFKAKMAFASEGLMQSYSGDGYEVVFEVTSAWEEAFNVNVVIENTGEKVIENWALELSFPHEIVNIWDANIAWVEGEKCLLKNAEYNQDIQAQQKVYFGFTAKKDGSIFLPTACSMTMDVLTVPDKDVDVSFGVTDDWKTGFNGEIRIDNLSNTVIEDWTLEFDFEYLITNIWTADIINHEGNHYEIKNRGWNANIYPGEVMILGFRLNQVRRKGLQLILRLIR